MTQLVTDEGGTQHYFPDDATPDEMNSAIDSLSAKANSSVANGKQPSYNDVFDNDKRAANDLSQAGQKISSIWDRTQSNDPKTKLDPVQGGIQILGAGIAGAGNAIASDVGIPQIGEAVAKGYNALPSQITQPISKLAGEVSNGISNAYNSGINKLADTGIADKAVGNESLQKNMQDISDTAKSVIPIVTMGEPLAKGASNVISGISDALGADSGVSVNAALGGIPSAYSRFAPEVQSGEEIKAANSALKSQKQTAYANAATLAAPLTQAASRGVAIAVPQDLATAGISLDSTLHPQTMAVLNTLEKQGEQGLTTKSLQDAQTALGQIAYGGAKGPEQAAAKAARASINNIYSKIAADPTMLANPSPMAIQSIRDANTQNQIWTRHSDIAQIVADAKDNPAKIQRGISKLTNFDNQGQLSQYAPDEQELIKSIAARGPVTQANLGKSLGKIGGAVLKGAAAGEMGQASEYFAAGHGSATIPIVTTAATTAAKSISELNNAFKAAAVKKDADNLLKSIASKAQPVPDTTSVNAANAAFNAKYAPRLTYNPDTGNIPINGGVMVGRPSTVSTAIPSRNIVEHTPPLIAAAQAAREQPPMLRLTVHPPEAIPVNSKGTAIPQSARGMRGVREINKNQ